MKKSSKILIALSAIGPGLFLMGYNIGTGSVTTMAKAGAEHGMTLFWALIISCVFTYILMVAYGQLTLLSGQTALFHIKNHIKGGKILAIYIIIALIIGELLALMGIMGIVSELIREGIRLISGQRNLSIDKGYIIFVLAISLYLLLWHGSYRKFEKILTFFVILMAVCFILVFFMVRPSFSAIFQGMVPGIPDTPGSFQLIAAMAGTTCSAAVFIIRSTVVAEKGWNISHLKTEKKDAFTSAFMMLFLSAIVMAVAAGTLNVMGLKLDTTLEMISLFEPLGGKTAAFILILGITGAGLSTVFPIVLIAPWLIADYAGKPRDIKSPLFRYLIFGGLLFSFGTVFLEKSPPLLMVLSQAFQAAILPAVSIPVFYLLNKQNTHPLHKPGFGMNAGLVAVILFSIITTWFAILGFIE